MTKEQFKAELILKFINESGYYPEEDSLKEIQRLADFAFSGE